MFILVDSAKCPAGWDTARVKRYITYYTWVPFEDRVTDDIIIENEPTYRIMVSKAKGGETVLTLWERYDNDTGEKDSDKLWGKTNERDEILILRYFDIDPILKKVSYFCKE